jgi:hypothetical protein
MRQGDLQLRSTGVTATMVRWRVLQARVEQLRHRTNLGAAWRQPSRSPRQRPPATTIIAAPFSGRAAPYRLLGPPQPLQLRRQRPGAVLQILQITIAVERPAAKTAGQATPVAGLRSARTGVLRRRPARAAAGLAEPRAGRDGDLPGPARLPAPHEASPPLACCQAPTNPPSKRARPSRSRIAVPPYSPPVRTTGQSLRAAGDPKATADASCTMAVSSSYCELHSKGRPSEIDHAVRR